MKTILTAVVLFTINLAQAQIEFNIQRISEDSISMNISEELEMGKPYEFKVITNIEKSEKLVFGFDRDIEVVDGNGFELEFDYHEFGFAVFKENKMVSHQYMITIKGTKYEVELDGELITRYKLNSISPDSRINIKLVSDNKNLSALQIDNPVVIYWMGNQKVNKFYPLTDYSTSVDLTQEKKFKKGINKSAKFNYVVLLLPQVKDSNGQELLAKEDKARMYVMKYER